MVQQSVAFFRNMNLGQRRSHSPTSAELLGAFAQAGATSAWHMQSNGTVVFEGSRPLSLTLDVVQLLGPLCGFTDAVVVRSRQWVIDLARALRAEHPDPEGEVVLFDRPGTLPVSAPWSDALGLLTVVRLDSLHAVTSWADPSRGSGANPVLTALLGVPVTCRGVPTMLRLADRLA